jgi:hypothetical protein
LKLPAVFYPKFITKITGTDDMNVLKSGGELAGRLSDHGFERQGGVHDDCSWMVRGADNTYSSAAAVDI